MSKKYDFYREPCQLCIERAGKGRQDLVNECGWCNDADTHYSSSSEYAGNILQIAHGGSGYPYHTTPHKNRKYYLAGRHLKTLDGAKPDDNTPDKEPSIKSFPEFLLAMTLFGSMFALVYHAFHGGGIMYGLGAIVLLVITFLRFPDL